MAPAAVRAGKLVVGRITSPGPRSARTAEFVRTAGMSLVRVTPPAAVSKVTAGIWLSFWLSFDTISPAALPLPNDRWMGGPALRVMRSTPGVVVRALRPVTPGRSPEKTRPVLAALPRAASFVSTSWCTAGGAVRRIKLGVLVHNHSASQARAQPTFLPVDGVSLSGHSRRSAGSIADIPVIAVFITASQLRYGRAYSPSCSCRLFSQAGHLQDVDDNHGDVVQAAVLYR